MLERGSRVASESTASRLAERCSRCLTRPARHTIPGPARLPACSRCFVRSEPVLKRALRTSLVVGTVLTLLNQGDLLLAGQLSPAMAFKIPLTYSVPFVVTIWGALSGGR